MLRKIKRGKRKANREQLYIIAELLKVDKDELLTLWLADQVAVAVAEDKKISDKVSQNSISTMANSNILLEENNKPTFVYSLIVAATHTPLYKIYKYCARRLTMFLNS